MQIQIPEPVELIIKKLEEHGFEAYAVGGCVRDTILGRTPGDWDITTSALPEQVKSIFRRTIDTGIEHGTVTVMIGQVGYEVTTYRVDGDYQDGRHPTSVTFTPSLVEDLKRRDFTINAMAYRPGEGVVDCFDGLADLENKIIRCVGDPKERFREDALRMMRAVRFSAQLGFTIEDNTKAAIKQMAGNLRLISKERIQAELLKLITSPHPDYIRTAYETGITAIVLPEFDRMMETPQKNSFHALSVGEHTIESLLHVEANPILRLTMLFHDMGKPDCLRIDADGTTHFKQHAIVGADITRNALRSLKFDNHTIDNVTALVRYHDSMRDCVAARQTPPVVNKRALRRLVSAIGRERFPLLMEVNLADNLAKTEFAKKTHLPALDAVREAYEEIVDADDCLTLKELELNGKDLMAMGIAPGKEIGRILGACLEWVLDEPERNKKELLTEYVKSLQE
ncbi:MAG: CCA tRNA nucleotidyltransferase [Lachnospiraceae bacterium]|nr:CCA tRNA nucleotidyltransferase [Lachnospiraceae bacterium]